MGCDPENGYMRELLNEKEIKENEILFKYGEIIEIKGCMFKVQQICGAPHHTITLKSIGNAPLRDDYTQSMTKRGTEDGK